MDDQSDDREGGIERTLARTLAKQFRRNSLILAIGIAGMAAVTIRDAIKHSAPQLFAVAGFLIIVAVAIIGVRLSIK